MEDAVPVVDEWLLLHSMLPTAMMEAETNLMWGVFDREMSWPPYCDLLGFGGNVVICHYAGNFHIVLLVHVE